MPYTLDRIGFGPDRMKVQGVPLLHITGLSTMIRNVLLSGVVVLALTASPVFAKSDVIATDDGTPVVNGAAPESLGEPSLAPPASDPALAMAAASTANDALASFGPSSGTVVGNRALELRDEVLRLRASVNLNSNQFATLRSSGAAGAVQYHSTVAAITARLQNGTTRGNPILLRQWEEANSSLDEVTSSLSRLNSLQTSVDADASLASYLLESIQAAFQLSGAVDEDHDQLKLLRDEVARMVVQLDYLRNQTTNDIERQTAYLTTERANLQALAFAISRGELLGNSLANRPVIVNTPVAMSMPASSMSVPMAAPMSAVGPMPMSPREYMEEKGESDAAPTIGRLLVLIRYNQPVVDYEQQLSQAVGLAMERRPNAEFSVVAVSPSSGDPADLAKSQETAQRDAEAVKRSLVQLGLSPSRIIMANTQSQNASTPEVHVYVR